MSMMYGKLNGLPFYLKNLNKLNTSTKAIQNVILAGTYTYLQF